MKCRAFSSWWRRIISQASAPSGGQSLGPALVALPRRAQEAGLPAASPRARSAPQLSRPLGAALPRRPALPRGLPLRDHLLLEPSAPAHLSSEAKGGTRTRSFPRCNSVALPRNWNPGFTQAGSARSSHPPESLARGSLHSGWARGWGWGMLGPFLKPRSMNSR